MSLPLAHRRTPLIRLRPVWNDDGHLTSWEAWPSAGPSAEAVTSSCAAASRSSFEPPQPASTPESRADADLVWPGHGR